MTNAETKEAREEKRKNLLKNLKEVKLLLEEKIKIKTIFYIGNKNRA